MRVEMRDDVRERQNLIIIGLVAVIVIFVVSWLLYSSYVARTQEVATNPPVTGYVPGSQVPTPGVQPTPSTPASPGAGPQSAPPSPPQSAPAPPAVPAPKPEPPKSATVLGSVVVTYPGTWALNTGAGGSAILTDGKATLEIAPADPSATDAKSAADLALADRAAKGDIKAQGARSLSGHDAYAYLVGTSAGTMRIVGVDAPTRIVIVESAKGSQFADHKATFDKIESGLRFK